MQFFIISRCFKNLSFVKQNITGKDELIVQNLKESVNYLYETLKEKFNHDDKVLKNKESEFSERFK